MPPASASPLCLIAVSVGRPRPVPWRNEVVETGIFKTPVDGPVEVGTEGLAGDGQADLSVHGGRDKAVYAYDESSAEFWRQALGRSRIEPGAFGENLTLRGAPEDEVSIGDVLAIGTARFEVSQPRQPCFKLGIRFEDATFPKRFLASGRVGFYLRVLEPGWIRAGDALRFESRHAARLRIRELVSIWTERPARAADGEDPRLLAARLERALSVPALAEAWRSPLAQKLRVVSGGQRGPTLGS